jgi:PAS domain S-box-containing protein
LTILSEFRLRVGATAAAMLIFCAIPSKAIDPHRMISQYARDRWTIENEFPGGATSAIAQTPDGYLWIGTAKGLFRFDGLSFRVFQQASPESLPIGPVQQLITDNRGNLWILLANTKLLRFHDGKFELGHEEAEVGVTAIGKRANGAPLFASLAYGALTYQDGKFLKISPPSDLNSTPTAPSWDDLSTRLSWATSVAAHHLAQPDSAVTSIAETSDGRVWLGTNDKGLFYLDHGRISSVRLPGESRNVRSLLPLENGDVWIGTERGVFRWNGTEASQVGIDPALRQAEVRALIRDHDANIWVGTAAGLARVNNESVSFDDVGLGRAEPVTALFEGREGGLWIGRSQSIERLHETAFVTYRFRTSQEESSGPVFVDATGRVWFASFKGGLQWLRQGQGETVSNDGLNQDVVYSISGGDNEIWVGRQRGGLTRLRYRAGRIRTRTYTVSDGLPGNSVYAVFRSRDGSVWAATVNAGISQFVDGRFKNYSTANGWPSNTITSIEDSPDGTMWFGTPSGLISYSRNKWSVLTSRDGLPSDNITSLLTDSTGILWIGTVSGLAVLRSGHITKPDSMPSSLREEILGMAGDNIGNLWIATSNHILSVKPARLLSATLSDSDVREYGLEDGLIGKQGVKRFRSVFADAQGKIWFSTDRGLAVVDPLRADRESRPVTVQIESLSADGNSLDLEPPIRVPPDTHRLTFRFTGLSLSDPKRTQFKYKLEGFDRDWSEPVSGRAAVYTNVNWGSYTFRVKASNSAGVWNDRAAELSFSIVPTWYQTRAFRVLLAASLLLGAWVLHRWRVHQLTAQEKRLRDVVETIPAMTFTALSHGSCTFVNRRWTEYTGLSVEETLGVGWEHAFHPADGGHLSEKWRYSVTKGLLFEDEARLRRADGEYRWFLVRGVPLRNPYGKVIRWYGTLTDIEDRRRAEETLQLLSHDLQESKARFEEAQRITHVGYWERDLVSSRITWSDETYRIFGLQPQEHPMDVDALPQKIHPEDWEFVSRAVNDALAGGPRYNVEYRVLRPTGELRIVHSEGDVKRDASGRPSQMFGIVQDITDRKRAEEALKRSEFYLREGERLAQMGSWAFNPLGFFDYWSQEVFQIYGLDPQQGAPTLERYLATLHPQDREGVADTITKMHAERSGCDVKKRIVRPDGVQRYIRCVGIPVVEGEVLKGFLGTAMDITEQELLTQELERQQAYLTEAQKLTHTGSWVWNLVTDERFWSEETFRIFEIDPVKVKPDWSVIVDRVHPDDRASLEQQKEMESTQTDWAESEADFRIVVPDGKIKHLHYIAHPVMDASGRITEVLGTTMDVTERRRIEDSLRRSESHLAEAQRLTHTGSWILNVADRKLVHLSDEWFRIFGFDPAEGAPPWEKHIERIHPDHRLQWKSILERAIVEKTDYDGVFRIVLPEGTVRWIHTVGHPVLTASGELVQFVGSSTDVTERKSAEQERERLRQLEDDLAHINRVSMMGEMAASLAHEIKQPIAAAMTSANSCIEWLAHEPPNLDRARAAAAKIDKYGNRAAEIIDHIRSLYRKSPSQRELIDVNAIVHEIFTLLQGEAIRYSIAMRSELARELPKIKADHVQLQQVFMNLILNAIEAMREEGGELMVKSQQQDGQLLFSVSDTGPGLQVGNVDQIFSAFFTTKPQGSGMGLAISRSIVESHGGRLWATANDGRGATFHFTLPTEEMKPSPLVT